MSEPTTNSTSPDSGGDTNYVTIALVVGIPCSLVIVVLVALISVMAYLTLRSSRSKQQEEAYMRRRFQGLSLEQQRKMKKKRKKRIVGRRESAISGTFNAKVSRTPSSVSAAAWKNPFGLQEWQIRMYSDGGEGSPDTEETELSGDEAAQRRRRGHPVGAINPLMVQNQVHDPGYDTPPHSRHRPHPHAPPTWTQTQPAASSAPARQSGRGLRQTQTQYDDEQDSSSDDSMNPYDEY